MVSRWGSRVEAKLTEPIVAPKPATLSEAITQRALEVEIEETVEHLTTALAQRLAPYFAGVKVHVHYDLASSWYVAKIECPPSRNKSGELVFVEIEHMFRDEDIAEHTSSTRAWNGYLDGRARIMRESLVSRLRAEGVERIETNHLSSSLSNLATTSAKAAGAMQGLSASISVANDSFRNEMRTAVRKVEELEESEAIKSIEESLKRRGQ